MYITPKMLPLEEFPDSDLRAEGMLELNADTTVRNPVIELDVFYAKKDGVDLRLHLIVPDRARRIFGQPTECDPCPTIFFIQGSAFHKQQLGEEIPGLVRFARKGYIVALIEYRGSEVRPFPAQAADAKTAVRWLAENADTYHVDVNRMAMWGGSSGGHTTLMTYATGPDQEFSDEPIPVDDPVQKIRCFIDFFGPTDISRMNEVPSGQDHVDADSPEGYLIGRKNVLEHPDLVAPTVIMNHIQPVTQRKLAPLLIMHGSRDRLVPFEQSVLLYNKLRECEQDVTFYKINGADHGGPAFWAPQVVDILDAFLAEHLA